MRKISFRVSREITNALAQLCRHNLNYKSGDSLFDIWFKDFAEAMLIKLAKYRNKTSKLFTVSFSFTEIIFIRELTDAHKITAPNAPEVLFITEYILSPALSITV